MLAKNLVLYAEECLKLPTHYIWGGIGEVLTPKLIAQKTALYPLVYTVDYRHDLLPYLGKEIRGFDCSGLINCFRMGGLDTFQMQGDLDQSSSELFQSAFVKGDISTLPELAGICLFLPGHVGIYLGNGRVAEATNNPKFGNGVVETHLTDRSWTHWFHCPGIIY